MVENLFFALIIMGLTVMAFFMGRYVEFIENNEAFTTSSKIKKMAKKMDNINSTLPKGMKASIIYVKDLHALEAEKLLQENEKKGEPTKLAEIIK